MLTYNYQLLSRLVADCKYFLGNGRGCKKYLWAGDVEAQITKMYELWESFPADEKPEWLSLEEVAEYAQKMRAIADLSLLADALKECDTWAQMHKKAEAAADADPQKEAYADNVYSSYWSALKEATELFNKAVGAGLSLYGFAKLFEEKRHEIDKILAAGGIV